jgi:hypothetical protein
MSSRWSTVGNFMKNSRRIVAKKIKTSLTKKDSNVKNVKQNLLVLKASKVIAVGSNIIKHHHVQQ